MSDETEAKQPAATKAEAWNTGPQTHRLPSGNLVTARAANLYVWTKTGQIPEKIMNTLRLLAEAGDVTMEERMAAIEWQLAKCIVEPSISLTPKEGCLCIDEIADPDKDILVMLLGISG